MLRPSREIAFPFHIGHDGGIAFVEDPYQQAFQHIVVTVLTQPGERLMVPEFGTPTRSFLFENMDDAVATEITMRVRQALERWEPSVRIHAVNVNLAGLAEGTLLLEIQFTVPPKQDVMSTVVDVGGAIRGSTDA